MNFYLKILNEVRHNSILKADGNSGARYLFKWDKPQRAYVYEPKNQDEVDDLFRTMGRTTAYIFAPVNKPAAKPAEPIKKTEEQPSLKKPVDPAITEGCAARGVALTADDDTEIGQRLLAAYDKGATDTLSRVGMNRSKSGSKPAPK